MEHQVRSFVNHKRNIAFVSANIDGMAAHASTVALRRFSEVFPELDVSEFETDKYMVQAVSKFDAYASIRHALQNKGFKLITQCEDLK
ncbi:hypothetical protein Aeh1ORF041c [Aeromonas phage Aeh1]|uniref:Uncharacterized protein n=1 Tax=Aeromonas phage Aeh1 TaxID=2880362 RepID=Q76Z46_9CAUD|nr:hypothetical protein Aeh1p045 [Aeromonas phage Aeh1]AAQ17700.1 hypothetical protein Aeh1ORF041c [Aeromonas phage Aeh1]